MSRRRSRAPRIAAAAYRHWQAAARDIKNRTYVALRVMDLSPRIKYPDSDIRECGSCGNDVSIDKRLIPLADNALAIRCSVCVSAAAGRPFESIILDTINGDTGEEL